MRVDEAATVVSEILSVLGPRSFAVWEEGHAIIRELRDQGVDATALDVPAIARESGRVLVLARDWRTAIADPEAWLSAAPDVIISVDPGGEAGASLAKTAMVLGWGHHPRYLRAPSLTAIRRLSDPARIEDVLVTGDEMVLAYDLIANFVRPGDAVLDIGGRAGGADIVLANSLARSFDVVEPGAFPKSAEGGAGLIIVHREAFVGDIKPVVALLRKRLEPGGRLVLLKDTDDSVDLGRIIQAFNDELIEERAFVLADREIFEVDPVAPLPGLLLLLAMRSPISPTAVPFVERGFFLPNDPSFHVADFSTDFQFPAIVRAIGTRGMRLSVSDPLVAMARKILPSTAPGSADRAVTLCTIAYQALESDAGAKVLASLVDDIAAWLGDVKAVGGHRLRGLISLLAVKAKVEQRLGRLDDALATASQCQAMDPSPFSPLLATRTLEAVFLSATIRLSRGEIELARGELGRAIPIARAALTGDWLNIIGDPKHPLPFGLFEAGHVLSMASRCAVLLSYLDRLPHHAGFVWTLAKALSNPISQEWGGSLPMAQEAPTMHGVAALAAARAQSTEGFRLAMAAQTRAAEAEKRLHNLEDALREAEAVKANSLRAAEAALATEVARTGALEANVQGVSQQVTLLQENVEACRLSEAAARQVSEAARLDARRARERLATGYEKLLDAERRTREAYTMAGSAREQAAKVAEDAARSEAAAQRALAEARTLTIAAYAAATEAQGRTVQTQNSLQHTSELLARTREQVADSDLEMARLRETITSLEQKIELDAAHRTIGRALRAALTRFRARIESL